MQHFQNFVIGLLRIVNAHKSHFRLKRWVTIDSHSQDENENHSTPTPFIPYLRNCQTGFFCIKKQGLR